MTERRTNRLLGVGKGFAEEQLTGAPHNLDDYVVWINAKERRRGRWRIIEDNGVRKLDWQEETASDGWLQERGLLPRIGRAA